MVSHLLLSLVALGLAFVPLFNLLGFEFAVTLGALLAYVSGWRACAAAVRGREHWVRAPPGSLEEYPGAALLRVTFENLSLTILPLAIISLNSLRVPTCNWSEGLQFYALFALPGILYGTTLGFALGLGWGVGIARLLFILWSLATYAYALWNVVREPPIFAFNSFIGFFPGPVYDRVIGISATLLVARGIVLLQSLLFVLLPLLLWEGHQLHPRALFIPWRGARGAVGVIVLLLAAALATLGSQADILHLRIDRAMIQRQLGGHIETEHFDIYYDTDAYPPERAAELAREHEFHYSELHEFFGHEPAIKIGSYVYASGAQKKRLMGAAGTSFEDALNDEFHLNASGYPHPVLRHEMAHIFTAHIDRFWRVCPKIGIHEGIAVAAEWDQESAQLGLTPDEACVAMETLGVLPHLPSVLGTFGFWTQAGSRAYTAAGAFIHYLVETRGMQRFRRLWSSRDFVAAYGEELETLVAEWRRERLAGISLTPMQLRRAERRYRPPALFAVPCAHEQARLAAQARVARARRQPARAGSLYARLVEIEPRNVTHQIELARSRILAGQPESALRVLRGVLDTPSVHDAYRGRSHDLIGDALWNLGGFAEAESAYVQALDHAASRDESRALRIAIEVLHDPALRDLLRDYLTRSLPDAAGLALLARARAQQPESLLPPYLLGRRLYFAGRFAEAVEELAPLAERAELPADVRLATRELCALALLRSGRTTEVEPLLDGLNLDLGIDLDRAEELHLGEIRRRAAWSVPATDSAWR
jgi:tetratricopeptide (TPR) repeat protein